jgi:hypothetical protein
MLRDSLPRGVASPRSVTAAEIVGRMRVALSFGSRRPGFLFRDRSRMSELGRGLPRHYAISDVRFGISIAQSRQSASGPPKSRLLGAHCGRSWPARPFSKADTLSAKRFRQLSAHNLTFG